MEYYRSLETHYGPPPPHHDPPQSHYEPEPHDKPTDPHYEEPETNYEPPQSHYEPPTSHYEPPTSHHEPPQPHYEPPTSHHEPSQPHYEPTEEQYGEPNPHHESPHNKKDNPDCVDISTWSEVKYKKAQKEHCKVEYQKYTEEKRDKVCSDVTSISCNVLPYTECEMKIKTVKHTSCEWFWNHQPVRKCHNVIKTITHHKKKPECTKVPKYHCEEKWEVDDHGKKVWAGNGDCKLIEWEDCKLVSVPAKFDYIQPDCSNKMNIPVHDIRDKPDSTEVSSMTCKVKKATKCVPNVTKKCRHILYTETVIKPVSRCEPFYIYVPFQERHHKQKCLFGDHAGGLPTDPLVGLSPGKSPHGPVRPTSLLEY